MKDPTLIPTPHRMRHLELDKRGFPVPVIIKRAENGRPLFAVNDADISRRCVIRKLCPICGERLTRQLWFVGGPRAAFDPMGRYFDSAMHHECMTYALQVCPYLAMTSFLTADSQARLNSLQAQVGDIEYSVQLVDPTQAAEKPVCFVAVKAYGQSLAEHRPHLLIAPLRPYHAVEFWRGGEQLTFAAGLQLVAKLYKTLDRPIRETDVREALRLVEKPD